MAATNKCLAQSDKSRSGGNATKKKVSIVARVTWLDTGWREEVPLSELVIEPKESE